MHFLTDPFELAFVQRGLFEVLLLSVGAGLLGTWIILRGLSFYAHAVGTAAFPGLVLADGLGFAAPLGAFAAGLAFAVALERLGGGRRSDYDSLTALVLAGALALGVILASDVFHSGANVESLLFGSLFLIEPRDLVIAGAASALVAITTASLGRAWLATGFDPLSARAVGVRSPFPELLLLVLVALTVIASVSAVGALLVTALLVTPAATTRIWTRTLLAWRAASVALTAAEGTAGLWLSVKTNAPPGATIAVLAAALFALSAAGRVLAARPSARAFAVAGLVLAPLVLASCTAGGSGASGDGRTKVVATTTQIGDWVRVVGDGDVDVHQILKPNTDPHEYEPRPKDVGAVAGADLVFENGHKLDAWASKLVSDAGGHPSVVDLGAVVRAASDPHWWHDPRNAERAVMAIRDALVRRLPAKSKVIERNARAYLAKLRGLDRGIAACMARIPLGRRKLVTDHDAFGYFARRYGIEIVGAVIPSLSTEAQPSAGELATLVRVIRREHVQAVFPEHSVNRKLATAIARRTGASSGFTLYGDALGPPGSDGATYLSMEAANARAIASGVTGGRVRCTVEAR